MEFFDASAPPPADDRDHVAQLRWEGATQALLECLAEVDELTDAILEAEGAEPLDPSIVETLERVTGARDAPAHFARVHERVERGVITWDSYWMNPIAEYRGYEIIQAAIAVTVGESGDMATTMPGGPRG